MKITLKGPGIKLIGSCTPEMGAILLKIVENSSSMCWKIKLNKSKKKPPPQGGST